MSKERDIYEEIEMQIEDGKLIDAMFAKTEEVKAAQRFAEHQKVRIAKLQARLEDIKETNRDLIIMLEKTEAKMEKTEEESGIIIAAQTDALEKIHAKVCSNIPAMKAIVMIDNIIREFKALAPCEIKEFEECVITPEACKVHFKSYGKMPCEPCTKEEKNG